MADKLLIDDSKESSVSSTPNNSDGVRVSLSGPQTNPDGQSSAITIQQPAVENIHPQAVAGQASITTVQQPTATGTTAEVSTGEDTETTTVRIMGQEISGITDGGTETAGAGLNGIGTAGGSEWWASGTRLPGTPVAMPIENANPIVTPPEESAPTVSYEQQFIQSIQQPSSADKGDIILDNGGRSSSKKKLVIVLGACITAVIVIVGIVALAFSRSGTQTVGGDTNTNTNIGSKGDFYSYANKILYDKDSQDVITEELRRGEYAYSQWVYNSTEFDQDYFDQMYQKYNNFYEKLFQENPDLTNGAVYESTTDYKRLLDFMAINPSGEEFSHDYIMEVYVNDGRDVAAEKADEILSRIPDNDYAISFHELKEIDFTSTIEFLDRLDEAGCIVDEEIDEECLGYIDDINDDGESLSSIISSKDAEAYNFLNDCYEHIGIDCWQIKNALEGTYK